MTWPDWLLLIPFLVAVFYIGYVNLGPLIFGRRDVYQVTDIDRDNDTLKVLGQRPISLSPGTALHFRPGAVVVSSRPPRWYRLRRFLRRTTLHD